MSCISRIYLRIRIFKSPAILAKMADAAEVVRWKGSLNSLLRESRFVIRGCSCGAWLVAGGINRHSAHKISIDIPDKSEEESGREEKRAESQSRVEQSQSQAIVVS